MKDMQVFNNGIGGELRGGMNDDGSIWFAAKDVSIALGFTHTNDLTRLLDDDEKGTHNVRTLGGEQRLSTITEPGMYHALNLRRTGSIKDEQMRGRVKAFQRQVNHEILPAIRRDGGYMLAKDETPEETMARAFIIAQSTIERQKARINQQSAQIEEMTPKALFADAVAASDGTCLVGELAKMLTQAGFTVGQNRLFKLLRADGYLGKHGCNRNVPKQRYIEQGLFRIKETAVTHADGHVTLSRTAKVTGKGQRHFLAKYAHAEVGHV
ncbi:phage antirepressor KilAC domain-containing protein [Atopobium fossor]|uniref:phage antirepressor KilAC domain-containing protein n=1 Tax=Atopobium fossor TaxID=39487 RepID=UPI00040E6AF5|nr:phage antirepressor KilAC domain-containing protein [Atopobium fossor]